MVMPDTTSLSAVSLGDHAVTLPEFLRHLKRSGRLQSLLQEAVVEQFLVQQSTQAGLVVTPEELQRTADLVRRRQGLTSAEQVHAWLARQRLSVLDFEDTLERDLLMDKLKDHLIGDRIAAHFEQHRSQYDRLRLRQLTVAREDLARELLSQVRDDGRDFAALAQKPQAGTAENGSSSVMVLLRRQLLPAVATALPTTAGEVGGPVATAKGFALVQVEEVQPAQLDSDTMASIRQELFEAWLREQLEQRPIRYPLLDELT
jgi:parvulin-like peptidyl-prolyl isomerase